MLRPKGRLFQQGPWAQLSRADQEGVGITLERAEAVASLSGYYCSKLATSSGDCSQAAQIARALSGQPIAMKQNVGDAI